jgi:hypothetical protein
LRIPSARSVRCLQLVELRPGKKRGFREVALILVAAALIMSPSYLSLVALNRFKVDVSIVAVMALVLFLVGAILLVKVVKE